MNFRSLSIELPIRNIALLEKEVFIEHLLLCSCLLVCFSSSVFSQEMIFFGGRLSAPAVNGTSGWELPETRDIFLIQLVQAHSMASKERIG